MEDYVERLVRVEVEVENFRRQLFETRTELKDASKEVRDLATEMRQVATELRAALAAAVTSATKPIENLWIGWRVLGSAAKFILGSLALVGGIISIVRFFMGK